MDPRAAEAQGVSIHFWDFLFYASFGFVVTSSVAIAGVLLVFCYLIVPSVGAMLYAERIGPRLAIGWTMGTVVSAVGHLLVPEDRPADGRHHRVYLRHCPDPDGGGETAPETDVRPAGLTFPDPRSRATFSPVPDPRSRSSAALLWMAALALMLAAAVWQRLGAGPARPRVAARPRSRGRTCGGRLLRSSVSGEPFMVALPAPEGVTGAVHYRRFPTDEPFREVAMTREGGTLVGLLPTQPPAGKLEYYVALAAPSGPVRVPEGEPIVMRFKGDVPALVLIPHVVTMFVSMMIGIRAASPRLSAGRSLGATRGSRSWGSRSGGWCWARSSRSTPSGPTGRAGHSAAT